MKWGQEGDLWEAMTVLKCLEEKEPVREGKKKKKERKKWFKVIPRNIEYAQINIIISGTNQKVPHFPTRWWGML